ncbi:MAG: hypothetical protein ACKOUR_09130 [Planctomycetota bacterium]
MAKARLLIEVETRRFERLQGTQRHHHDRHSGRQHQSDGQILPAIALQFTPEFEVQR